MLRTKVSIWHIYGSNLSGKVASNLTSKRTQLTNFFQEPKYDALTNCDIEHVTDNLVSTVSQKSKSYLKAAKVNLSDNNNNQTFPIRPKLKRGVAVNERVPTAEPPTAPEVVPAAELPVTNEDVPTNESSTEVVGVTTAYSPTL